MFERIPILLQADRCLNRRYRQPGCDRCVQSCPVRAIELHGGAPALDPAACVNCGACLPACPTDVFSQRVSPEGLLVQTLEQVNRGEQLAVACAAHPDPASSRAPVDRVLRHSRCLAGLGLDHLLALSSTSGFDVWLDDSPCATCAIGQAHKLILRAAQAANALLESFDRPGRIRLLSQAGDERRGDRARLPVDRAAPNSLARRDLFARFKRFGEDAVSQATAPQSAEPCLPPARQRLLRQVERWTPPPAAMLALDFIPFAAVQVDGDACSACGLCAALCPTHALRLDTGAAGQEERRTVGRAAKPADQVEWRLNFRPAACIDCGICARACPEQAVSYAEHLLAGSLSGDELTLAGGRMTSCASCGTVVAIQAQQPTPLCYACRQGAAGKMINPMADNAGLMTDLLKRTPHP